MNIWNAFCESKYYNLYFNILVKKFGDAAKVAKLKYQYQNYLTRIKDAPFLVNNLKSSNSPEEFEKVLSDIFDVKWANHIQYKEIPFHFKSFLSFLDSIQAIHNDYINDDEKDRLLQTDRPIIEGHLSKYELEYLKEGKLIALMNPKLLHILKHDIETRGLRPASAGMICKDFYGDLIPLMTAEDYIQLVKNLWTRSRKVQGNKRNSAIKIEFPTGDIKILSTQLALREVVLYYSIDKVLRFNLMLRGRPLLLRQQPFGDKDKYNELESGKYINITGNITDVINITRAINQLLGGKLQINLSNS